MIDKHCFYKYGSVALSCLFFLMLIVAMKLEESEQSKTKQPLKIFKNQNVSVRAKQNTTRVIFLPPPPLETPKVKTPNIQSSATTFRQQFNNDIKQVKTFKRKQPQKVRKVLKPTVGYNSKYSQTNPLKRFKKTNPIQIKNYEGQKKKRTTREIKPPIKVNRLEKGRVLLKKLEYGKGPQVEVSWPKELAQKQVLYSVFTKCFGMKTAGLNSSNQLFVKSSGGNRALTLNMDTTSGFIREIHGDISRGERDEIIQIEQKHPYQTFESFVRIFPRHVDASLLQGLHLVLGDVFSKAKQINASYRLNGYDVEVSEISADTQIFPGSFHLRKHARKC